MEKFIVGSRRFFGDMPDYQEHDYDVFYFLDENEWPDFVTSLYFKSHKDMCDIFIHKKVSVQEYIDDIISGKTYDVLRVFSLLVPEIVESMNFTVKDLPKIKDLIDRYEGKRHGWYIIVYNSYIENNGFFLTEEQKQAAYEEFKKYRAHRAYNLISITNKNL